MRRVRVNVGTVRVGCLMELAHIDYGVVLGREQAHLC